MEVQKDRVLRKSEVEHLTGTCERWLREWEAEGDFPKRFKLHPKGRTVGWLESEVNAWLGSRSSGEHDVAENKPVDYPKRGRGRPKGSRNKATKEVREVAQKHTASALRELKRLLSDEDAKGRLKAAELILQYGHGKPSPVAEHNTAKTEKDG